MNPTNHYKISLKVQNGLGVLARIAILLRKYNINIQTVAVKPLDDEKSFYIIDLLLDSTKNEEAFFVVLKKLERLIPVVEVHCQKHDNS